MHLDHVYSSPLLEWLDFADTRAFGEEGAFDGLSATTCRSSPASGCREARDPRGSPERGGGESAEGRPRGPLPPPVAEEEPQLVAAEADPEIHREARHVERIDAPAGRGRCRW